MCTIFIFMNPYNAPLAQRRKFKEKLKSKKNYMITRKQMKLQALQYWRQITQWCKYDGSYLKFRLLCLDSSVPGAMCVLCYVLLSWLFGHLLSTLISQNMRPYSLSFLWEIYSPPLNCLTILIEKSFFFILCQKLY